MHSPYPPMSMSDEVDKAIFKEIKNSPSAQCTLRTVRWVRCPLQIEGSEIKFKQHFSQNVPTGPSSVSLVGPSGDAVTGPFGEHVTHFFEFQTALFVCVCDLFKISPSPHLLPLPTENHSNTQRSIEHQIYTSK